MNLLLARYYSNTNETIGGLHINGEFSCFTLEDEKRDVKVMAETRIPEGEYFLALRHSPSHSQRYGHDMIYVENVPGFSGILIHKGNTEKDTAGCILVGNTMISKPSLPFYLSESTLAYDRIYPIISDAIKEGAVHLIIRDFWASAFA